MALSSSNAAKQLSDQNSQGTILGASATDTIGFYGAGTPRAQATITGSASSGVMGTNLIGALHDMGLVNSTGTTA